MVINIALDGPVSHRRAEISGLAWYGDYLVLLPQYPQRLSKSTSGGAVFAIPRSEILDYLDEKTSDPITPIEIPLESHGIEEQASGFEGFEAVMFRGNTVYLLIEAYRDDENKMVSYLVSGEIAADLSSLELDPGSLTVSPLPRNSRNKSNEALLLTDNSLLAFYEINGQNVVENPYAAEYDFLLDPIENLPLAHLEYRITDATDLDTEGRFWVMNTYFPGDMKLSPTQEPLESQYGQGPTHARNFAIQRLVELQYTPQGITLTNTPPIQLQLEGYLDMRNWEGLARLGERGFLLATDKFPTTLLGFVAYP